MVSSRVRDRGPRHCGTASREPGPPRRWASSWWGGPAVPGPRSRFSLAAARRDHPGVGSRLCGGPLRRRRTCSCGSVAAAGGPQWLGGLPVAAQPARARSAITGRIRINDEQLQAAGRGRRHDERTVAAQWRLWRSGVVTSAVHDPFAEAGSGPWHVLASGDEPPAPVPLEQVRRRHAVGRPSPSVDRLAEQQGIDWGWSPRSAPWSPIAWPRLWGGVARPRGLRPRPGRGRADPDGSVRAGAVRLVGDRGPSA